MSKIAQQIAYLEAATAQLVRAAATDDWNLVERVQKRRVVLVGQIVEAAHTTSLSEDQMRRLATVRQQEAAVAARTATRRDSLSRAMHRALNQTSEATQRATQMGRRIRKAYGGEEPKR